MDTKNKIIFNLNGKKKEVSIDRLEEVLSVNSLYTGSIAYNDESSSYYFSLVNSEELCYVLNELKTHLSEVKIEVRSHAKDTKEIQRKGFEAYYLI